MEVGKEDEGSEDVDFEAGAFDSDSMDWMVIISITSDDACVRFFLL